MIKPRDLTGLSTDGLLVLREAVVAELQRRRQRARRRCAHAQAVAAHRREIQERDWVRSAAV